MAETAAIRKTSKYQEFAAQYIFQPPAFECLGSMNSDIHNILVNLGRRITKASSDDRGISFLFQRISVLFRFNSVLLFESFELGDRLELWPFECLLHSLAFPFSFLRESKNNNNKLCSQ